MPETADDGAFRRRWLAVSLLCLLVAAWRSAGYYHPDEQFQTLEFAGSKLGLTPTEALPWEYGARIRPWIQPAIYVVVVGALRKLTASPFAWAAGLRELSGLYAWVAVVALAHCCQRWLEDRAARRTAIRLLCAFCLVPFVMVRTSSESLATSSFFLGLALSEIGAERGPRGVCAPFASGLLLGLAFEFRFAVGPMVAGWFAWAAFVGRRPRSHLLASGLGVVGAVAVAAGVDRWGYGEWSLPPLNYLRVNLGSGQAAERFGSLPVWGYLQLLPRLPFGPAAGLAAAATALAWLRHPRHVLTWTGAPMLIVHSLIGHKEMRFLFPLLPAAAVSFGLALAPGLDPLEPLARLARSPSTRWVRRSLFAANAVALAILCLVPVTPLAGLQRFVFEQLPPETELLVLGPDSPYGPRGLVGRFYVPPGTAIRILAPPALQQALRHCDQGCSVVVPAHVHPELLAPAGRCREVYRSVPSLLDELPGIRALDRWVVLRCDAGVPVAR